VGARIETPQGPGKITEINVLQNRVMVTLEDGGRIGLPTASVACHRPGCVHMRGAGSAEAVGGNEAGEIEDL
jgi:hypothetical protein